MGTAMKRFYLLLAACASMLSACETVPTGNKTSGQSESKLARVTAYWPSEDRYTRRHQSSTGTKLRAGHAAVDPVSIPYGSRIQFGDGSTVTAVDTGRNVRNRKAARYAGRTKEERAAIVIDRFFERKIEAIRWLATQPLFQTVKIFHDSNQPKQR